MDREIVQKLVDVVGEVCRDQALALFFEGYNCFLQQRLDDAYDAAKDMLRETG